MGQPGLKGGLHMHQTGFLLALVAGCASIAPVAAQSAADTGSAWTVSVDGLAWESRASPLGIPFVSTGVIGEPETRVLLGPAEASFGTRSGLRLGIAYALSPSTAIEFSAFGLERGSYGAGMASDALAGSQHLYIPYIDPLTGQETATDFSVPDLYSGKADLASTERLRGGGLDGRWSIPWDAPVRLEALAGLSYLYLAEAFTLDTASPLLPAWGPDVWQTHDAFTTHNRFFGIEGGLRGRFEKSGFFGTAEWRLAAGSMRQSVDIDGWLLTDDYTFFEVVEQFPGGYFALPSNMGHRQRNQFAWVSQARLEVGYRFSPRIAARLGYSGLYASRVVRPGDQISRTIDTGQSTSYTEIPMPGPVPGVQPVSGFHTSAYLAHGINAGIDISF